MNKIIAAVLIFGISQAVPIIAGPPWQGSVPSLIVSAIAGFVAGWALMSGINERRAARRERQARDFWSAR